MGEYYGNSPRPEEILGLFVPELRKATNLDQEYVFRLSINKEKYRVSATNQRTLESKEIAEFSLAQLPGCCGVCVSYHATTVSAFRKKGIGRIMNKFRLALAANMKFGLIMCTVTNDNLSQIKILEENGWGKTRTFTNPKTKRVIVLFEKAL